MERYTGRNEKGDLLFCGKQVYGNNQNVYNAISLLEDYEKTGLAPDEIPRWIDAESETPEIGQRVLLYFPDKEDDIRAGKYLGDGDYRIGMKVYRGYEIGAWMPLPAAPKEEK